MGMKCEAPLRSPRAIRFAYSETQYRGKEPSDGGSGYVEPSVGTRKVRSSRKEKRAPISSRLSRSLILIRYYNTMSSKLTTSRIAKASCLRRGSALRTFSPKSSIACRSTSTTGT